MLEVLGIVSTAPATFASEEEATPAEPSVVAAVATTDDWRRHLRPERIGTINIFFLDSFEVTEEEAGWGTFARDEEDAAREPASPSLLPRKAVRKNNLFLGLKLRIRARIRLAGGGCGSGGHDLGSIMGIPD